MAALGSERKNTVASFGFLVLAAAACLIIYLHSLSSGFHLDDKYLIADNYAIRNVFDLPRIWLYSQPRFLTNLTFALNFKTHHLNPAGYRLFNLLIHLAVFFVFFLLAFKLFEKYTPENSRPPVSRNVLAVCAAGLFLVHPVQTQTVIYISQRSALLAAFFYITTVLLYLTAREKKLKTYYAAAFITAFCSMISKEISFTLPLAIALTEYFFYRNTAQIPHSESVKKLFPFLLLLFVIPFFYLLNGTAPSGNIISSAFSRASETQTISRGNYFLTQFNVIGTYLRLFLLPAAQNLDYDYPVTKTLFEAKTLCSSLTHTVILTFTIAARKKNRIAAFGILWFYLALAVESSVIPIRDVIFEHRMYLPMAGLSITAVSLLNGSLKNKNLFTAVMIAVFLVLSLLTFKRTKVWQNEITLWSDVVQKSPAKARGYSALGNAYGERQNLELAMKYCRRAIEIDPKNIEAMNCLGTVRLHEKNLTEAIHYFEKTMEVNPNNAKSYANLALAYGYLGNPDKVIEYGQKALVLQPHDMSVHYNVGVAYLKKGDNRKAAEHFRKALEMDKNFKPALTALSTVR